MEEDKQKTCYIYERVSTDDQKYSIGNQTLACRQYAEMNNYIVLDSFAEDGKTGRNTDRPEFQSMLKRINEHPVDAIIIYKIDRFARNVSDFNNIRKELDVKNIKLVSVNEGDVTTGLIGNIFASVAEWESDVISQRTKDGMMEKFRRGLWPSSPPIGYKTVPDKDDEKIKITVPDLTIAPLVQWSFKKYATGRFSFLKIVTFLHKKGFKTRNGRPIAHSTLHKILTNKFYYGLMRWGGKEIMGKHEPLISKSVFDLCQVVAAKHRDYLTRERKHDFLLRGFVFCARCGHRYTAEYHYEPKRLKKKGGKIAYYHCAKRTPCKSPYIESKELERKVQLHISKIKFTKGFTDTLTNRIRRYLDKRDEELFDLRQGLLEKREELADKRHKLEERLYEDVINRETFKRIHKGLQDDISNVDIELSKLEKHRGFNFDVLEEILALIRNIPKTYKEAPDFLKKAYLNFFFDRIEVDNKMIVNTVYSPLLQELIKQKSVILRQSRLEKWYGFGTYMS